VTPPDRWGDTISSQMAVGVDILPRQYLTFWEALVLRSVVRLIRDAMASIRFL
jgi:hypothetical protein